MRLKVRKTRVREIVVKVLAFFAALGCLAMWLHLESQGSKVADVFGYIALLIALTFLP